MHISQPIKMRNLAAVLVALLVAGSCCCDAAAIGRVQLTHTGTGSLTGREALQRMAHRSKARAKRLLRRGTSAPLSPGPLADHDDPHTEYLIHLGIGTPPQPVVLTFDTGSDLTWTQCQPCLSCFDQALPHFALSQSSTFGHFLCESAECQHLPYWSCGGRPWGNGSCVYTYFYGDKSLTNGRLGFDTFTFAGSGTGRPSSVPGQPFGCGFFNSGSFKNNETGIAGFGRGPLSLPSRLKLDNFSHCFTTHPFNAAGVSKPSSLLLDLPANLYRGARGAVQTTPLLQNPRVPTIYYLSLKGITVGRTRLPVPESAFALASNGTGGTIIDSGSSLTTVPPQVHRLLKAEFASQLVKAGGASVDADNDQCFTVTPGARLEVPKLVLHFEGATLDLPRENYIFKFQEAGNTTICLAFLQGQSMTTIGNFQQQNLHVLYDLANNKLSFVHAQCDKL
ncbi:unnamed protein product [Urochloa decumbens]|uniref:Peptidase A1 domain-containing protein n=1 Tax=Urochloa decumbens TaxID=240449 RepID=A0ABC9C3I4_9POAL